MTMGLPCDQDDYDLRIQPCKQCGSRGCPKKNRCENDAPKFRADYLRDQANRLDAEAFELKRRGASFRATAARISIVPNGERKP